MGRGFSGLGFVTGEFAHIVMIWSASRADSKFRKTSDLNSQTGADAEHGTPMKMADLSKGLLESLRFVDEERGGLLMQKVPSGLEMNHCPEGLGAVVGRTI
jgi:hypothetical protein